jgi:hypothetical protein
MAMLPSSFNSEQHDDMGSFEPIPVGDYVLVIEDSELKPSKAALKDADGNADLPLESYHSLRLNLKFKVVGGDYDGRIIFNGLNIKNPNAQAVEISQKELATICRAVGKVNIRDSAELHGIPMKGKVGIKAASAQYDAQNVIKSYAKFDGVMPQSTKPGAASPTKSAMDNGATVAQTGNGKKLWDE